MPTRRLETNVEQLKTKSASQLAEIGRKGDAINRLKIELGTLRDQLHATEKEYAVKATAVQEAERALSDKELQLAKLMGQVGRAVNPSPMPKRLRSSRSRLRSRR